MYFLNRGGHILRTKSYSRLLLFLVFTQKLGELKLMLIVMQEKVLE